MDRKPHIVIVGGCGHVGLPLALAFARRGRLVCALDVNAPRVAETNAGRMPFYDRGADEALRAALQAGAFWCTTDPAVVAEADAVILVVGTPVDEHLSPRFNLIESTIAEFSGRLRPGQLLILRSTVYPGTTRRVSDLLARLGLEIDVAFCPERVAQGAAMEEIVSLPQIVAGCTPRAQQRAEDLFRLLTDDLVAVSPTAAELTKLFNNVWRYIQFAVANQFFMIANDYEIDFDDVHRAMTHHYPRAQGVPRAGFAAGPCLFKDTMQLSAFHHNNFFLGHAAMLVNEGLPHYIVQRLRAKHRLAEMTVGVLGMAFKGEVDDLRDSLALKLTEILRAECRDVLCADPFVREPWILPLDEVIARAELLIIGAPHAAYRNLKTPGKTLIDIWRITPTKGVF